MYPLPTLKIDAPNLLICECQRNPYMEKINDPQSAGNLRDRQTGLDLDPSGADISTVSGCTVQTTSGKCIRKKWTQEKNRIVMECYYRSKPKINGY